MLVEDLAWCWWTQPRATRLGERLFLGGIDSRGEVFAAVVELGSGAVERSVLARLEPDDHNNPALVVAPGKRALAFYSRHDADEVVRYRIGARAGEISEWGEERLLRFDGITTYAQAHVLGDEVHLFTRVGGTAWGYARSEDWGASWRPPCTFLAVDTDQETYMPTALLPDGRTLRVGVAGHPKSYERRPWREIRVCLVDLATGVVSRPSDGVRLGNVRDGSGLPLRGGDLELVYAAPEGRTLNLLDVSDGEPFEVAFTTKVADDRSTREARYEVARLRPGWEAEVVVETGATFGYIDAGFYVGGIAFPHDTPGGVAYVSREDRGIWRLERWDRREGGEWTPTPLVEPSPRRVVRPWPVRNPVEGMDVVALALERYEDDYMETLSHLVAVDGRRAS